MHRLWLLLSLLLFAGAAQAAENAPIGDGFGVQVKEWRTTSDDLDQIKATGARYLRFGFLWNVIERRKGEYDWSKADAFMEDVRAHKLHVVYELGALNQLYGNIVDVVPQHFFGDRSIRLPIAPVSDEAREAFKAFAVASVKRYNGKDVIWEIWNEPDVNLNWPPEADPKDFTRLISETCHAIKVAVPDAKVIGPAFGFLPSDPFHQDFLKILLHSPAGLCLDAISIHPYRHGDNVPEGVAQDYESVRAAIARNTPPGRKLLPIVSSEWGYSLSEVTEEQQAAYVLRSLLANIMNNIPLSIWYEWRDSVPDPGTENREAHFGLRDYDNDDKLSARVLRQILPHLADARIEKRIPVGDDKIYALLLKHPDGRHDLLFWYAGASNPDSLVLTVNDGAQKTYPVGIIPAMVCSGASPSITVTHETAPAADDHYFPCAR